MLLCIPPSTIFTISDGETFIKPEPQFQTEFGFKIKDYSFPAYFDVYLNLQKHYYFSFDKICAKGIFDY